MKISHWKSKLLLTAGYLVAVGVFYALNLPCVFQGVLGIVCPGCGMTRAMMAALRLDFGAAFGYHWMFWSVPVLYLYFLLDDGLFPGKWADRIVLWGIALGFVANWLVNLL